MPRRSEEERCYRGFRERNRAAKVPVWVEPRGNLGPFPDLQHSPRGRGMLQIRKRAQIATRLYPNRNFGGPVSRRYRDFSEQTGRARLV